ncbi:MAG: T9SS type A sorting domain-containing protein, partial [Bacteroidota bacterium]
EWYATEYLVMDLSLALNDTFWIYQGVSTQYPFVVDSVFSLAGKKHVRLTYGLGIGIDMCGLSEKIEFIEGTGPNCGFGYQGYANGGIISAYLLCHKKDQIFVYGNKIFNDVCEICQIGIEELKTIETSFSCFPNPFSDKIDFLFFENGIYSISLFDSAGKKIVDFSINGQTHSISTASFSDGIYFVRVTTTEGKVEFRKLVKE